jgi:DNA helicase-2/ATP-dependent DNA helicase PcrA
MTFIADLHIHSRFSRATSRSLDAEELFFWAAKKGISVVGTGDITHPEWLKELRERLVEAEDGLFRLRPDSEKPILGKLPPLCRKFPRFMLSGEISCIYKKDGHTRKLHHLVLLPDFGAAERFNSRLDKIGNIKSDGRPILGLDSRDLLEIVLEIDDRAFFIPAHIWTPWFSLFGSKSGFDSIEACFEDLAGHIHALETGLSSDPPMNRLLSALDSHILVSNSDAHSASKLGREANLFDTERAYDPMIRAMTDGVGFKGTIEFYPEEGKYHLDGHRKCAVRMEPWETHEAEGRCPKCGAPVTVGVLSRVEELADREEPELQRPFFSLIPLCEILSELFSCGPNTKKVSAAYEDLLAKLGPELEILMSIPIEHIEEAGGPILARAVGRMRDNKVIRQGGYDGEYGVIRVFVPSEIDQLAGQDTLFSLPRQKRTAAPKHRTKRKKKKGPNPKEPQREEDPSTVDDSILGLLNPEQKKAVLHRGTHLLITAGPGTGKTLTLTRRIAHMIREGDVSPERILALTFTNKASIEMGERIKKLVPATLQSQAVRVSTFHRFCLETLREKGPLIGIPRDFRVCTEIDTMEIVRRAALETSAPKGTSVRLISRMPDMRLKLLQGQPLPPEDSELYPSLKAYQRMLRDMGMLDLDDLEVETLRLFTEHPDACKIAGNKNSRVFVDEYQDTSPVQAALLKALVDHAGCEITAIGDPDQAIYGFRGADVGNFLSFMDDFPGAMEVSLSQNYRSKKTILSGAAALLDSTPLEGVNGDGNPIKTSPCATHREEAEMAVEQIEKLLGGTTYFSLDSGRVSSNEGLGEMGFGDIAVLFRLNAQADAYEEAFSRAGIPYVRSGEKPLIANESVQLLWRFLQALLHPGNIYYKAAYLHLMGDDKAKGEKSLQSYRPTNNLEELVDIVAGIHGFEAEIGDVNDPLRRLKGLASRFRGDLESFLDSLCLDRGIDHSTLEGDRVALMSFHAAKGLEWPVVFLCGLEDGLMPLNIYGDGDVEEERRLLYVALTRARDELFLSWAGRRTLRGRPLELPASRFLKSLPPDLQAPLKRADWKPKRKQEQLSLFNV